MNKKIKDESIIIETIDDIRSFGFISKDIDFTKEGYNFKYFIFSRRLSKDTPEFYYITNVSELSDGIFKYVFVTKEKIASEIIINKIIHTHIPNTEEGIDKIGIVDYVKYLILESLEDNIVGKMENINERFKSNEKISENEVALNLNILDSNFTINIKKEDK